jgi:tRNA pseudouridine32 synthase/23S rRNA pseudouridine746 synthase
LTPLANDKRLPYCNGGREICQRHLLMQAVTPDTAEQPLILYRDAFLLAVEKPSGLLSVPGRGADKQDCLLSRVRREHPSGIMLFALDSDTQRDLGFLFETRRVTKQYVACVRGVPDPAEGEIDLPLAADWPRRPRQRVDFAAGKAAHTRYRVVESTDDGRFSRVQLSPATGRSHQLRVHLAESGHPVLGDELYADQDTQRVSSRLMLHAERLCFEHPRCLGQLRLHSPVPF